MVVAESGPVLVRVGGIVQPLTSGLVALRGHGAGETVTHIRRLLPDGLAGLRFELRFELLAGPLSGARGGAVMTSDTSDAARARRRLGATHSEILPVMVWPATAESDLVESGWRVSLAVRQEDVSRDDRQS